MTGSFVGRRDFILGGAAALATGYPNSLSAASMAGNALNFLVVGDWGRKGDKYQRDVARRMETEARRIDARFVASTGDNFYNLGVLSTSDKQWDSSFERIYDSEFLQRRWYPTLGNHDYGGSVSAQVARTGRGRWYMPERWYVIRGAEYGRPDIDLFFIDTPIWTGRENFPYAWLGSSISRADQQAQTLWLTEKLLSSTAKFKIVFGHYPIYSVGKHGGKPKMLELDRLLRRTGVSAYVCGHDHCQYHIRSIQMDYVCSGGGSQELPNFTGAQPAPGCVLLADCPDGQMRPARPMSVSFSPSAGFASFSISQSEITMRFIDRNGLVVHDASIFARRPDPDVELDRPEVGLRIGNPPL